MFIGNANIIGYKAIAPSAGFPNEYSLLFDGVNEDVNIAGTWTELDSATNYSVSAWVKVSSLASEVGVFGLGNTSTINFTGKILTTGKIRLMVNNSYLETTSTISTGTWYHIVFTYDGTQGTNADRLKIHVDGSNWSGTTTGTIATSLSSVFSSQTVFRLGLSLGPLRYMNGYIDEVSFYNYTLSVTQAGYLYGSGTPTDLDNTSGVTAPVHWWRMGDGSDTISTIYDIGTGTANNGTPQNMESGDIVSDVPS